MRKLKVRWIIRHRDEDGLSFYQREAGVGGYAPFPSEAFRYKHKTSAKRAAARLRAGSTEFGGWAVSVVVVL